MSAAVTLPPIDDAYLTALAAFAVATELAVHRIGVLTELEGELVDLLDTRDRLHEKINATRNEVDRAQALQLEAAIVVARFKDGRR